MRNVGMMTPGQLNGITASLRGLGATIDKGVLVTTATSPKGEKIMSAAKIGRMYHVRAKPGLIVAV